MSRPYSVWFRRRWRNGLTSVWRKFLLRMPMKRRKKQRRWWKHKPVRNGWARASLTNSNPWMRHTLKIYHAEIFLHEWDISLTKPVVQWYIFSRIAKRVSRENLTFKQPFLGGFVVCAHHGYRILDAESSWKPIGNQENIFLQKCDISLILPPT